MSQALTPTPPFDTKHELVNDAELEKHPLNTILPMDEYLHRETCLKDPNSTDAIGLNDIYSHLWMAGLLAANTRPLHYHKFLGRDIVIVEQMRLHLTWRNDQVFLKPIPKCFLNYKFWSTNICKDPALHNQVLRFLFTYIRLIRHESDFNLAHKYELLPEGINWKQWIDFTLPFLPLPTARQRDRWDYGDLRLSRINLVVRVFRWRPFRGWIMLRTDYNAYFTSFFAALAATFAVFSVALSAFQVAMSPNFASQHVLKAGYWFSIVSLLLLVASFVGVILWFVALFLSNAIFAVKSTFGRRKRIRAGSSTQP
ncbi:hypothetical protein FRC18_011781 [Serendipita sp. 400]|nr:hypothetical protein FRC18_011781 [Serendipita sp. 400]